MKQPIKKVKCFRSLCDEKSIDGSFFCKNHKLELDEEIFPQNPYTKRDLHYFDKGAKSQAKIFNETYQASMFGRCFNPDHLQNMLDSANEIKKYSTYGEVKTNWGLVFLVLVLLGVISCMIFTPSYGNLIADVCK